MARVATHDLREYRRGMVLGLTLAETLLLLLFLLLMVVAAMLWRAEERERSAEASTVDAERRLEVVEREVRPLIEALAREGLSAASASDLAARLEQARQLEPERDRLRRELVASQTQLRAASDHVARLQAALQRQGSSPEALEDALSPLAPLDPSRSPSQVRDGLVEILRRQPEAGQPGALEAFAARVEAAREAEQVAREAMPTLQRQVEALRAEVERQRRELGRRGGAGALYPSCWMARGQPEAAFDITLRTGGEIEVRDAAGAERRIGAPWSLLGEFPRGVPIPIETFLAATREFSAWSTQQVPECRFQVNVRRDRSLDNAPNREYLRVIGPLGNAASNHLPFYRLGG